MLKGIVMYFFIILVCLQSNEGQCVPLVEDPPTHYESIEKCESNMMSIGTLIAKDLKEDKEVGKVTGQCFLDESVKAT